MKTIYCTEIFRMYFGPPKKLLITKYGRNNVTFIQEGREITLKRMRFIQNYRLWSEAKNRAIERKTSVIKKMPLWVGKEY